jgi:hypothetical protein
MPCTACAKIFLTAALTAAVLLSGGPAAAQTDNLPRVRMIVDDYDYMVSLFPDDYPDRPSAIEACADIALEAEALRAFWETQGQYVMTYMAYYAGMPWAQPAFDIYLVKYFPDYAAYDPMTIPLAGKKSGRQIIPVLQGLSHKITLFQQLAKRLLMQASQPGGSTYFITGHPLLEKTSRRFDNLANLLALTTMKDFFPIDSVLALFQSAHWRHREPGQDVLFGYLWGKWNLSQDSTLAMRLAAEPYDSRLVELTLPPRPEISSPGVRTRLPRRPTEGGRLGLAVTRDQGGDFRVVEIDTLKLAYTWGLRKGDLIRSIEGETPRNIKQLFTLFLDHWEEGAQVTITRRGEPEMIIIYPWGKSGDL